MVKDAAAGIAGGIRAGFPEAEPRDDCFHALYKLNKVRLRLERKAYAAIQREATVTQVSNDDLSERCRWEAKTEGNLRTPMLNRSAGVIGSPRSNTLRLIQSISSLKSLRRLVNLKPLDIVHGDAVFLCHL